MDGRVRDGGEYMVNYEEEGRDHNMMTSSNGNIFRVIGPLCLKFTGHRWILLTKANDAELWCFLRSAFKQTVE